MRRIFIGVILLGSVAGASMFAFRPDTPVRSCADYASLVPQDTPEATLALELSMMEQGEYCYRLPIFDEAWQSESEFETNPRFTATALRFKVPSETYIDGDLAMVHYPNSRDAGPDFLYRTEAGWVIDRTTVREAVIYNANGTNWYVSEAAGRYLPLVEAVFAR